MLYSQCIPPVAYFNKHEWNTPCGGNCAQYYKDDKFCPISGTFAHCANNYEKKK